MLVSEAIQQAFREGNLINVSESPSAAEQTEALRILNSFWQGTLGAELGENLLDWFIPATDRVSRAQQTFLPDYPLTTAVSTPEIYPAQNSTLLVSASSDTTIYFPEQPNDGARMRFIDTGSSAGLITLNGNSRLIEGAAAVIDTPANLSGRTWFYRADTANWTRVQAMALADSLPLPADFDDLFITYMSIRLAPRHSQTVPATTLALYQTMLQRAKVRYRQQMSTAVTSLTTAESISTVGGGVFVSSISGGV